MRRCAESKAPAIILHPTARSACLLICFVRQMYRNSLPRVIYIMDCRRNYMTDRNEVPRKIPRLRKSDRSFYSPATGASRIREMKLNLSRLKKDEKKGKQKREKLRNGMDVGRARARFHLRSRTLSAFSFTQPSVSDTRTYRRCVSLSFLAERDSRNVIFRCY